MNIEQSTQLRDVYGDFHGDGGQVVIDGRNYLADVDGLITAISNLSDLDAQSVLDEMRTANQMLYCLRHIPGCAKPDEIPSMMSVPTVWAGKDAGGHSVIVCKWK